MKRTFLAFALLGFSSLSFANGTFNNANANADATAKASAVVNANPFALAQGGFGVGLGQGGTGGAGGGGGNASVFGPFVNPTNTLNYANPALTYGVVQYSGQIRNNTMAFAPGNNPTSPCMGSSSAGVSGLWGGFSGGTSWTDKECSIRATSSRFQEMGLVEDAVAIQCQSEYAQVAPSCAKYKKGDSPVVSKSDKPWDGGGSL